MKKSILVVGLLLIALNSVVGLVSSVYSTFNFLMVDASLLFSIIIIYFVANSNMADGFKIGLSVLFSFSGIARCLCMAFAPDRFIDNIPIIVASVILFLEFICLTVPFFTKKR